MLIRGTNQISFFSFYLELLEKNMQLLEEKYKIIIHINIYQQIFSFSYCITILFFFLLRSFVTFKKYIKYLSQTIYTFQTFYAHQHWYSIKIKGFHLVQVYILDNLLILHAKYTEIQAPTTTTLNFTHTLLDAPSLKYMYFA